MEAPSLPAALAAAIVWILTDQLAANIAYTGRHNGRRSFAFGPLFGAFVLAVAVAFSKNGEVFAEGSNASDANKNYLTCD